MQKLDFTVISFRSYIPECPKLPGIENSKLWSFWTLLGTDTSSKTRCVYVLSHAHAHVGRGLLFI
jgi:hypothetical protein